MAQKESSGTNHLLSLAGIIGTIMIFAVILYVAYLPGRPPAVDQEAHEVRRQKADEARAAGLAKITGYEVIDQEAGLARIPLEEAMNATVIEYKASEGTNFNL